MYGEIKWECVVKKRENKPTKLVQLEKGSDTQLCDIMFKSCLYKNLVDERSVNTYVNSL